MGGYREPANKRPVIDMSDVDAYDRQLQRRARRRKIVWIFFVGLTISMGVGLFCGPPVYIIGTEAWNGRHTKLTAAEAKEVDATLGKLEAQIKKSQDAFAAAWPKMRAGEIGPRRELGGCSANVDGAVVRRKDDSVSLSDSEQASGWLFVDLTPAATVPAQAIKAVPAAGVPTLPSSERAKRIAELRAEAAQGMRHDSHHRFVEEVRSVDRDEPPTDVVVLVDLWEDPKFNPRRSREGAKADPVLDRLADLEAARDGRPVRAADFEGGFAIARAFAWSAREARVVCASQALATSSSDITFRTNDLSPLQRDLLLQLETSLERSFVAVGDAPPKLERPHVVIPAPPRRR